MQKLFSKLASLKLTVALVLVIAVVLSAGTILESLRGPEAAKAVYEASWFYALLGLLCLNAGCALIDRWPKTRWRIGFVITHVSMLLILGGALVTVVAKVDGQMPIFEGEDARAILRDQPGHEAPPLALPFAIHLDAFELDTYPGTGMPAQYRSRVTIVPNGGAPQAAVIEMNKPLSYGGFKFFQSSYRMEAGRKATVLAVAHDPGQPIVFFGYTLLVAGMIVVFATRLVQAKQAAASRAPSPLASGVLLALLALAAPARAVEVPDAATVEALRVLPVQHDGRTMPFDTQAREAVRKVTGRSAWPGLDHVAMVAGWTFDARGWQDAPILKVGGAGVAQAAGLPAGTAFASLAQCLRSPSLGAALRAAHAAADAEGRKPTNAEKGLLKFEERLETLYGYFQGDAVRPFPNPDPKGAWRSAKGLRSAAELAAVAESVRKSGAPAHYPDAKAVSREILYNRMRPSRLAWLLLLPAAILAALTVGERRARLRPLVAAFLVGGFAAMTWGIAVRWQIAGRVPASNMYESMLFLGWGVGLFGVVALALRQRLLISNAAGMGALAMMLVDLLPMDPFIHPMMPVLTGTPWLAIHVPIIVVSYSVLAMATGLAHLVVGVEIFAPARRDLAARWSELLYWYLHVGSILLITGILTGSIWAASSWGRYWGWDPKEVWSLVAFLAYMAILHARFDEQIRAFGVAVSSIAAFWTILMTYLGVNFVLASGLHSYGFGSSSLLQSMAAIALLEIAFLVRAWTARRRRSGGAPSGLPVARG